MKFHEYLGKEKENLLISVLNFREDYHLEEGIKKFFFNYFQVPNSFEERRYYFVLTLLTFLHMFIIFKVFFDSKLVIIDPSWEQKISDLRKKLESLIKRYSKLISQGKIFNPNEVS